MADMCGPKANLRWFPHNLVSLLNSHRAVHPEWYNYMAHEICLKKAVKKSDSLGCILTSSVSTVGRLLCHTEDWMQALPVLNQPSAMGLLYFSSLPFILKVPLSCSGWLWICCVSLMGFELATIVHQPPGYLELQACPNRLEYKYSFIYSKVREPHITYQRSTAIKNLYAHIYKYVCIYN